ncbi:MAG TPA: hypothetical protein O0X39_01225 [Methanocorpusculum sp.]|nr:hypothetical protein [Methanocorpusculum sp.]
MTNIDAEQTPSQGIWQPPYMELKADIAGYRLELTGAIGQWHDDDGLRTFDASAERWTLSRIENGTARELEVYDIPGSQRGRDVWHHAKETISKTITDEEQLREAELQFYRKIPAMSVKATEALGELWYKTGDALNKICASCARTHVGDKIAIRAMLLSYAATRVINGEGIHISISGSAGTGKSHAASTAAKHLPNGAVADARLSDKALYYHQIYPGTVLLMDDQELTEDFQEVLKVASTDWSKPATYLTVNNQKPLELHLPERCPFWIVKANLNGDEQVLDRQLIIWTDESTEQLKSIQQAILQAAANPDLQIGEGDAPVCRAIWDHITAATVIIPYAGAICMDIHMDPRNIKLLIALTQAHALMAAPARETENNGQTVIATMQDFMEAAKIINPLLENIGGSQKLKLSSAAARVLEYLSKQPSGIIPFANIRKETGMSKGQLSQAINGRNDLKTEGLLKTCPAIELTEENIPKQGGGTFRQTSIIWNAESYEAWRAATGMFYMDLEK